MKALIWHDNHDVRVESVLDPVLFNPRDAIVKITSTARADRKNRTNPCAAKSATFAGPDTAG
jgi:hypothetical protein